MEQVEEEVEEFVEQEEEFEDLNLEDLDQTQDADHEMAKAKIDYWTERRVLKLIACVKKRRCIWDSSITDHKSLSKRTQAIDEIAAIFKTSRDEIRRKWGNLRTQYSRDIRGRPGITERRRNWMYRRAMSFLENKDDYQDDYEDLVFSEEEILQVLPKENLEDSTVDTQLKFEEETFWWSEERALELIEQYRSIPQLWNLKHPKYNDKQLRAKNIICLADSFQVPPEEIKRKLNNLNCQFIRQLRHLEKTGKTSKWFAFPALYFLKDRREVLDEATHGMLYPPVKQESKTPVHEIIESEWLLEDGGPFEDSYLVEPDVESIPEKIEKKVKVKDRLSLDNDMVQTVTLDQIDHNITAVEVRDEFSIFGEHVACKIRKLKSERAQSNVQHIINTILWEAEYGKFDDYQPTMNVFIGNPMIQEDSTVSSQ